MSADPVDAPQSPIMISIDGVQTDVRSLPWWRRPRSLRRQLVISLLLVALLSVILIGSLNFIAGDRLLDEGTQDKIAGIGEARSRSIELGIDRILAQVSTAAADLAVADAVNDLTRTFDDLAGTELSASQVDEIQEFYQERFIEPIADAGLDPVSIDQLVPDSNAARYLQYQYVVSNSPDDLPARRELVDAGDGSDYTAAHARHHPTLDSLATSLGVGDLLLVSDSGEIVYSVDKRIDLGTDLRSGPYASTVLAETVLSRLSRQPVGEAVIADQGIYIPGGGRAIVFVAAQVRRDTEVIGTLVAEIPIEALNLITTVGGNWESVGLGQGESYVIGADQRLRSESRLWIEDPDAYLEQIDDDELRGLIQAFGSPVGIQPVETDPATQAFDGSPFEGTARNYLGESTYSYSTPIDASGVDWVVVVDVPLSEARGPLFAFARRLGLVLLVILPIAGLVGFWMADRLTRPIPPVVDAAFAVAGGERNLEIPDLGKDEFGDLARRLEQMARRLAEQEQALEDEFEQTRDMLLTVLPSRLVRHDGTLDDGDASAFLATVIAVSVDVGRQAPNMDETEVASWMDHIRVVSEELAERFDIERVRASTDRYLYLSRTDTDGTDHALRFASELAESIRSLADDEDAPLTFHIGISAGPVATGILRQGSLTFGAWGEPVRRALAISALSPANEILVDSALDIVGPTDQWDLRATSDVVALDGKPMDVRSLRVSVGDSARERS